jgi:hypothetical protein
MGADPQLKGMFGKARRQAQDAQADASPRPTSCWSTRRPTSCSTRRA